MSLIRAWIVVPYPQVICKNQDQLFCKLISYVLIYLLILNLGEWYFMNVNLWDLKEFTLWFQVHLILLVLLQDFLIIYLNRQLKIFNFILQSQYSITKKWWVASLKQSTKATTWSLYTFFKPYASDSINYPKTPSFS